MGFFRSRSEKQLQQLVSQFDQLTGAGWEAKTALLNVFDLAERLRISHEVLIPLCAYPPIRQTIEANRDDVQVKTFLRGPDLPTHKFPG
jgi:hypothetical protein